MGDRTERAVLRFDFVASSRAPALESAVRLSDGAMQALIGESKKQAAKDKSAFRMEYLFLPAEHVGQSVPRGLLVVGGGLLAGAVSLATMPLYAPISMLTHGVRGFSASVGQGLKAGLGIPVACVAGTCKDVSQSVRKTADILKDRVSNGCLGFGRTAAADMKVAILIPFLSSRGDIQPVLALAIRLQAAGMNTRLFLPIGVNFEANMSLIQSLCVRSHVSLSVRTKYEQVRAYGPSVVLYRRDSTDIGIAWVLEEQCRVPTVEYEFWPHPPHTKKCFRNILIGKQCLDEHLGVKTLPDLSEDYVHERVYNHKSTIYAFSESVAERQDYWPESTPTSGCHALGYWAFSREQELAFAATGNPHFGAGLQPRLESFASSGEPPVFIGWGSMNGDTMQHTSHRSAEELVQVAVRALMTLGKRGVIQSGRYGRDALASTVLASAEDGPQLEAYAREHVLWVEWAPHNELMPLCSTIVHHGGCSTTGSSLRAGRPTVITPLIWDQFYWAYEVEQRGVGVKAADLQDLTSENLAEALRQCESPEIIAKAAALGEQLRAEDGAGRTAEWLRAFIQCSRGAVPRREAPRE